MLDLGELRAARLDGIARRLDEIAHRKELRRVWGEVLGSGLAKGVAESPLECCAQLLRECRGVELG